MPTIQDGQDAIEQGNLQQARLIFEAILQETPRSAEAWLGLAEVMTDTEDKRICYENVLKIDKTNRAAKEGLRNLEPQANPLIAALQEKSGERPAEEGYEEEEDDDSAAPTMISTREDISSSMSSASGASSPPTYALVAIGLVLSVVVFAIGGGLVFFALTALTGG
jgi:hypothetical protein